MRPKLNREKRPKRSARLLFMGAGIVGVVSMVHWRDWPAQALVLRDPPTRTDVAIVFAGDPGYERTAHAARLFHDGLTAKLFICGGEPGPGDHADSLKQYALAQSVPTEKILMENRSTNTRETLCFAKPILERHRMGSITLVTSPYHQRRAFLVTQRLLGPHVKIVNSPADPSFWSPKGWWRSRGSVRIVLTEYGKLAYYWARGWI